MQFKNYLGSFLDSKHIMTGRGMFMFNDKTVMTGFGFIAAIAFSTYDLNLVLILNFQ